MPEAARKADYCAGHGGYPSRPNNQGSPNVYINSRKAHRRSDSWVTHCHDGDCHSSTLLCGSESVFVNSLNAGRIGDQVECGSRVRSGSPNVFIGGECAID